MTIGEGGPRPPRTADVYREQRERQGDSYDDLISDMRKSGLAAGSSGARGRSSPLRFEERGSLEWHGRRRSAVGGLSAGLCGVGGLCNNRLAGNRSANPVKKSKTLSLALGPALNRTQELTQRPDRRDSQRPPAAGRSPADRAGALARHRRQPHGGAGGGGGAPGGRLGHDPPGAGRVRAGGRAAPAISHRSRWGEIRQGRAADPRIADGPGDRSVGARRRAPDKPRPRRRSRPPCGRSRPKSKSAATRSTPTSGSIWRSFAASTIATSRNFSSFWGISSFPARSSMSRAAATRTGVRYLRRIQTEHVAIYEAIRDQNTAAARKAARRHLSNSLSRYQEISSRALASRRSRAAGRR